MFNQNFILDSDQKPKRDDSDQQKYYEMQRMDHMESSPLHGQYK